MKIKIENGMSIVNPHTEKNIKGGTNDPDRSIFFHIGEALGYFVKGLIVFGQEGGRNAGLTVK